jgi:hypothetical protein
MLAQVTTLLRKNASISWRKKQPLKELLFVVFLVGLIKLLSESGSTANYLPLFYMSIAFVNYSRFVVLSLTE